MTGKTVLITGSSRGIGLAFTELYVKAGWNVIATARSPAAADALKALSPSKIIALDTSDEDSIDAAAKELAGTPIDLLINNAGIEEAATFETATKSNFMKAFEVNAVGTFLVTRALVENLRLAAKASGSASVANISSLLGSIHVNSGGSYTVLDTCGPAYPAFKPAPGSRYPYRTSKAAVNMITTSLAMDLKADNIIVVAIQPGLVKADFTGPRGIIPVDVSVHRVAMRSRFLTRPSSSTSPVLSSRGSPGWPTKASRLHTQSSEPRLRHGRGLCGSLRPLDLHRRLERQLKCINTITHNYSQSTSVLAQFNQWLTTFGIW